MLQERLELQSYTNRVTRVFLAHEAIKILDVNILDYEKAKN